MWYGLVFLAEFNVECDLWFQCFHRVFFYVSVVSVVPQAFFVGVVSGVPHSWWCVSELTP